MNPAHRRVLVPPPRDALRLRFTPRPHADVSAALGRAMASSAGEGWAVLWSAADGLAVTGPSAHAAAAALHTALRPLGAVREPSPGPIRDPRPLSATCARRVFGADIGNIRATLVVGDVRAPTVTPLPREPELRCPFCRVTNAPVPILGGGFPSDTLLFAVERGEIGLHGCMIDEPGPTARCRHCEGTFVAGGDPPERVVGAVGAPLTERVRRNVYTGPDAPVWTPFSTRHPEGWRVAVARSVLRDLARADALAALRLGEGAVVFGRVRALAAHAPDRPRIAVRVDADLPDRILVGGASIPGTCDVEHLPGASPPLVTLSGPPPDLPPGDVWLPVHHRGARVGTALSLGGPDPDRAVFTAVIDDAALPGPLRGRQALPFASCGAGPDGLPARIDLD